MARHVRRREPRAHWWLLVLGLTVLLAGAALGGFVDRVGAEGGGSPSSGAADPRPAPAAVTGGGPVLRFDGSDVASRSMPAGTVALTFDDGPDPVFTPQILDVLARHGARATFFVVGSKVNEHPELARRIVAEGHEIGVHTFSHVELAAVPGWRRALELTLTQNAIAGATGRQSTLLRPPYAAHPSAMTATEFDALRDSAAGNFLVVLADHDTRDWSRPGVDAIVAAATPTEGSGAVVLFHDGGGDRSQTVAAVDRLLADLSGRGVRFTTVSDGLGLVEATPPAPVGMRLRGEALRIAQWLSGLLIDAMTVVLVVALVLGVLRLLLQVVAARVHVRRRRRDGRPLRFLGTVSVVVPAYNEAANIAATVRSLARSDYPRVEVIVVDDGSTDGTAEIVRRLRLPNVFVISQPNAGKPAALNRGIAMARGDFLVLVDGDTVLARDAVGRLVQPFVDPTVGAVSGNTKVANRRGLLGRWQHIEYVIGFNLDRRMFEVGECMPTVPGAIGAFRREAIADVGGVPAGTLAEDTDLTMAVLRAGWRVVYEEAALAWTEAPANLRQLWRQRYRWCYGTMQAMWRHRAALVARGQAGKLGRRGLVYLVLFQVLLPLAAPAVDAYAVYGLIFLPWHQVAGVWLGFLALQTMTAAYALRLDRERLSPLWALPLQQVVFRQLMYLVVIQSTVTALVGSRLRWQRVARVGAAGEALGVRYGG
ncbi:MAG TPA: bifunctional polysaccharide deacetylase/glycosyltransferase family 2 protein [Micromonosporaceae bacterium]|nr:bifunctional polysaccharide deacetylase/glycosyltransferase family 2 protein [Micromonosporaceae bacterium]